MNKLFRIDKNCFACLKELKNRILSVQIKTSEKVNSEIFDF